MACGIVKRRAFYYDSGKMEPFCLVAEVVIGLTLDAAGAFDKVRDSLGRNPAKLAHVCARARAQEAK
ncbi:MAG: hypothetical protein IT331_01625 [Anaerolineae bacterium]|nr:hypothetical protein [Anaerolineae bacterium]